MGVWSLATLVTGLTRAFPQMLAARTVLGIGEASFFSAATSLVGDLFSKRARGRAMAAIAAGGAIGVGGGLILAGLIGLHFGWGTAFHFAAGLGLLLALLTFALREPLRGTAELRGPKLGHASDASLGAFAGLLRIRTYAAVLAAGAFGFFGLGAFQLVPLYVHRRFGLDIAQAGALVGIPSVLGGALGRPLGGWLLDWRGRHSSWAAVEVGFIAWLVTGAATVIWLSARSVAVFESALIVSAFGTSAAILTHFVAIQNVILPSLRASAEPAAPDSDRFPLVRRLLRAGVGEHEARRGRHGRELGGACRAATPSPSLNGTEIVWVLTRAHLNEPDRRYCNCRLESRRGYACRPRGRYTSALWPTANTTTTCRRLSNV